MQDWTEPVPDCPTCGHPEVARIGGTECPICLAPQQETAPRAPKHDSTNQSYPVSGEAHEGLRPEGQPATPTCARFQSLMSALGDPSKPRHELRGIGKVIPELTPDGPCDTGQAKRNEEARVPDDTASPISNAAKSRKT